MVSEYPETARGQEAASGVSSAWAGAARLPIMVGIIRSRAELTPEARPAGRPAMRCLAYSENPQKDQSGVDNKIAGIPHVNRRGNRQAGTL